MEAPSTQKPLSIREISDLTGVAIDTLRIWERRYGFPEPERDANGVREFSSNDIERISLLGRLTASGKRIGQLMQLDTEQLHQLLKSQFKKVETPLSSSSTELFDLLLKDDPKLLRNWLRNLGTQYSASAFVKTVAAPMTTQIGQAWESGQISVRQEHLFSDLLREQLRSMQRLLEANMKQPRLLFTTLPGELHVLGLEMAALISADCGAFPIHLGASTPIAEILVAAQAYHADVVGLSLSASAPASSRDHLKALRAGLPATIPLWLGGVQATACSKGVTNTVVFSDFSTLEAAIADFRRRGTAS